MARQLLIHLCEHCFVWRSTVKHLILRSLTAAALFSSPVAASATVVIVDAKANSTSGGTSKDTGLTFATGQQFRITSSTNDLWSSGALPRFSDANGIVFRLAVAGDDSGQAPGTQIGSSTFGNYTQGNLSARYGSLVADLGNNTFQLLGANGVFVSQGGPLKLAYFDSNSGDNSGFITFNITAVPEPATWALMLVGFGMIGFGLRSRRKQAVRVTYA